jgi:hypothetical protein
MEPPNNLMTIKALGIFRYYSMILNGLTRIFSGALCVIRDLLGKIGVIRPSLPDPRHFKFQSQRLHCPATTKDRRVIEHRDRLE